MVETIVEWGFPILVFGILLYIFELFLYWRKHKGALRGYTLDVDPQDPRYVIKLDNNRNSEG